ncbi:MAG: TolC family protein [Planctomycetaceae bacterium]
MSPASCRQSEPFTNRGGPGPLGVGANAVPRLAAARTAESSAPQSWEPLYSKTDALTRYSPSGADPEAGGGGAPPAASDPSGDFELAEWTADAAPEAAAAAAAPLMGLDELVEIALSNNPSIRQAAATAEKAMGVHRQVGLYPNPVMGYQGQEMGDSGTAGMQGAFVTQTIVLGDKLAWNRSVARQEVQSLLWQVESQRFRVRNDVRQQFYETLGAQERLKLADELYQIADDGLENARILKEAQQAALPDVLQAKVQLQEVQIIQRNAAYQYAASWERLAALAGWPDLEPVELQPVLFDEQPLRDRETAWEQIASLSPQLRLASAEVQRARMRISRERVQPIPNLQLQVGVMHLNVPDDNAATVQLGLPVPLFNANEGNIDRAAAEYHRASQNVRRLELSLQAQLADTFRAYQQALNRVVTYRDEILPAQSETLELIQQAYPLQFDFLRLLTARRMYYEARLEYLEAAIELRQAEVSLDGLLLTGGLSDVPDTSLDDSLRGSALSGQ